MTERQSRQHKKAFLDAFRQHGNVTWATRAAGIQRTVVYDWQEKDEAFLQEFRQAELEATETMEQEAYRRAMHGTAKPVFHQGEQCGSVQEYSDTLLIFMLKARAPDKYRETIKTQGTVTGPNGGPVEVRQEMSPDAMSSVIAAAEQAAITALYGVASSDIESDKNGKI